MIYHTIIIMQKRLITSLCFITLSLSGCNKPQIPETQQHTTSETPQVLSQNNIADLTADIAALQSLQSLQGVENIDFINDLLNIKKQDNQASLKKDDTQMQSFIQQYDQELNQLTLTSLEADQFRAQLKIFNQLALQLSALKLQEKPDKKTLIELKNKIIKTQKELSSQYSQMEQKISASGKETHK